MPEDNVIRPVFGARKVEESNVDPPAPETSSENEETDFEDDIVYFFANLNRVLEAHQRGDTMTNYLFDDVGYKKTDASLELRRPVVRKLTIEEFCDRLLGSDRREWRAQPAFYGALFLEFNDRQNSILDQVMNRPEFRSASQEQRGILLKIIARSLS